MADCSAMSTGIRSPHARLGGRGFRRSRPMRLIRPQPRDAQAGRGVAPRPALPRAGRSAATASARPLSCPRTRSSAWARSSVRGLGVPRARELGEGDSARPCSAAAAGLPASPTKSDSRTRCGRGGSDHSTTAPVQRLGGVGVAGRGVDAGELDARVRGEPRRDAASATASARRHSSSASARVPARERVRAELARANATWSAKPIRFASASTRR